MPYCFCNSYLGFLFSHVLYFTEGVPVSFNMGDSFLFVVHIMYIVFPCDIFALNVIGLISHKHGSNIKRSDSKK